MASTQLTIGLDLTVGVTTIARKLVAVVAVLGALLGVIAAHRPMARRSRRAASPTRLDFAGGRASVEAVGVAVVALFVSHAQAIAAFGGLALHARGKARSTRLELAVGSAAVARFRVAVVTSFGARDATVAALDRGHTRLARSRANEVLLHGCAVRRATITGLAVAVVAELSRLDLPVAAATGWSISLGAGIGDCDASGIMSGMPVTEMNPVEPPLPESSPGPPLVPESSLLLDETSDGFPDAPHPTTSPIVQRRKSKRPTRIAYASYNFTQLRVAYPRE